MENQNNQNQIQIFNNNRHIIRRDNILKRLKRYIFRFIFDIIHQNLINKMIFLLNLHLSSINNYTKLNERIFNMKISDILYEQENIGDNKYFNRKIIDRIYKEKKERNVIKILELTFEELLIIFRRKLNDSDDLKKLEDIKDKIKGLDLLQENDKYKDIQYIINQMKKNKNKDKEYFDKFKKVCLDYGRRLNYKI